MQWAALQAGEALRGGGNGIVRAEGTTLPLVTDGIGRLYSGLAVAYHGRGGQRPAVAGVRGRRRRRSGARAGATSTGRRCDGTKGRLLARPGRCVSVGRHSSMRASRGNVKFCAMGRLRSGMTERLIGPS